METRKTLSSSSVKPTNNRLKRSRVKDKYPSILNAAVKIFAHKGFFQAKVSEIAREAGVADGTVYLYFKGKDDLLISIFKEKMREILTRFRSAIAQEKDARSRLNRLIQMHLAEFQAYPDLAAVFQVELRQSSRFMLEYENVELKKYLDLIGEIVKEGQQEGIFRQDIPLGLIKRFVFGALDETVSTWVLAGRNYDLTALADSMGELFWEGIHQKTSPPEESHRGGSDYETTRG
jgi:TetR/AcrR family fatty acid metabolism transcriptional regulator